MTLKLDRTEGEGKIYATSLLRLRPIVGILRKSMRKQIYFATYRRNSKYFYSSTEEL